MIISSPNGRLGAIKITLQMACFEIRDVDFKHTFSGVRAHLHSRKYITPLKSR